MDSTPAGMVMKERDVEDEAVKVPETAFDFGTVIVGAIIGAPTVCRSVSARTAVSERAIRRGLSA